jgi:cyanophycinase
MLHVLPAGAAFDLTERTLLPTVAVVSAEDAAEIAEAQADLRRMARDIAAGDVGPTYLRRRLARTRAARKTGRAPGGEAEQRAEKPAQEQEGDIR